MWCTRREAPGGQVDLPAILSRAVQRLGGREDRVTGWGPERGQGRERPDGTQESGVSKPALLNVWEPGSGSNRAPSFLVQTRGWLCMWMITCVYVCLCLPLCEPKS